MGKRRRNKRTRQKKNNIHQKSNNVIMNDSTSKMDSEIKQEDIKQTSKKNAKQDVNKKEKSAVEVIEKKENIKEKKK